MKRKRRKTKSVTGALNALKRILWTRAGRAKGPMNYADTLHRIADKHGVGPARLQAALDRFRKKFVKLARKV